MGWINYEWGKFPDGRTGWHLEIRWPAMLVFAIAVVVFMVHC